MAESVKKEAGLIFKHSSIYGISNVLKYSISFVMIPIYTSFLTPGDYGVMELLYMTTNLIRIIVGLGISQGVSRFYFDTKDQDERNRVISSAYIGLGGMLIPIIVLIMSLSRVFSHLVLDSDEYTRIFLVAFAAMGIGLVNEISIAYFRTIKKSVVVSIISVSKLVGDLSLNILFVVVLRWGVWGIFLTTLITTSAMFFVLTPTVLKKVGIRFSKTVAKGLFKFGLPLIPGNIASYIVIASDRYFIKEYVSLSQTGIYSLGYKFGTMVSNFVITPFIQIWFPRRFELFGKENSEHIFSRVFTYFCLVLVSIGLLIAVPAKDIVQLLANSRYWEAYTIIPLLTLAHVVFSFFYHFNIGILIEKKTKYFMYINIMNAILNITLNLILIRRFGMWGAAWATFICYVFRSSACFYFSNRLHKIEMEWRRVIHILTTAFIYYFLFSRVSIHGPLASFVAKAAIVATFPFSLYVTGLFEKNEVDQAKVVWRKISGIARKKLGLSR